MSTPPNSIRYAISDRRRYAESEPDRQAALVSQARRLAAQGVDYIQLREKDLPTQDLIGLAREILNAIRECPPSPTGHRTQLLINSRADVALAVGADGVHLPSGEDQLTPAQLRALFDSKTCIVSISCHTLADVARARECDADLILFGAVFGKSVAGQIVVEETGLEALSAACKIAEDVLVLALGGVTIANAAACLAAGAGGVAAIRLFS